MQYEKIILGMMDRIAALEERVSALEGSGRNDLFIDFKSFQNLKISLPSLQK